MLMISSFGHNHPSGSRDNPGNSVEEFLKGLTQGGVNIPSTDSLILGTIAVTDLKDMYVLKDGGNEPVKAQSIEEWAKQRENKRAWLVHDTDVVSRLETYSIHTYFLGYDMSNKLPLQIQQAAHAKPITFLSVCIGQRGSKHNDGKAFSTSLTEAKKSHADLIEHIKQCEGPPSLWRRLVANLFFWSRRRLYGS